MVRAKTVKISLCNHGEYLGFRGNEFFIKDQNRMEIGKWDASQGEIGEITIQIGNLVSTTALVVMLEQNINAVITGFGNRPIGILKSLDDDSHVKTRIAQYEALKNGKGIHTAKQFVIGKIEGQNQVLRKYGLKTDTSVRLRINAFKTDDLNLLRRNLLHIEGKFSEFYFNQIFQLIPEKLRPQQRKGFKAYDGMNNLFNFGYQILFSKCYQALVRSHLECYLGFLHSVKFGRASLVCDFQELYRYLIDDFIIEYSQHLHKNDFQVLGKLNYARVYLSREENHKFRKAINDYFQVKKVELPRICRGEHQEIETLINEEALLFAKFLRGERETWIPRIAKL